MVDTRRNCAARSSIMTAYRAPDFKERAALSKQTKQKALDHLRAKAADKAAPTADDDAKK
jgi:hypothetical protein